MENLTPLFIALTGAAVMLQAGVLVAMYLAMRKSSSRLEALAVEVKTKALPTLEIGTRDTDRSPPQADGDCRQFDGNDALCARSSGAHGCYRG